MPGIVRAREVSATLDGSELTTVLTARYSMGYDLSVGEGSIVLPISPGFGDYYTLATINLAPELTWSGLLVQNDRQLHPRALTLVLRDPLFLAQQYVLPDALVNGLALADLTGGPATDEDLVFAVLDRVPGLSAYIGSIDGTGTILGTIAPEEFVWKPQETALSYIQRIDAISLGHRTFWNGSEIVRPQISSRPIGSPDLTFTEGLDIREGTSSRTVQEAFNAVRVGGYAVGDYADPRVFYIAESNPFQSEDNPRVFNFTSSMIERRADDSPGQGISCESMCNYFLGELNREIVRVTMRTPRLERITPAQIHRVQGPGGSADRLGVGELLWVQRVDAEAAQDGSVSQSPTYIGGGTAV